MLRHTPSHKKLKSRHEASYSVFAKTPGDHFGPGLSLSRIRYVAVYNTHIHKFWFTYIYTTYPKHTTTRAYKTLSLRRVIRLLGILMNTTTKRAVESSVIRMCAARGPRLHILLISPPATSGRITNTCARTFSSVLLSLRELSASRDPLYILLYPDLSSTPFFSSSLYLLIFLRPRCSSYRFL